MTTTLRSLPSALTLRQAYWERSWKHRLSRIMIYVALVYFAILVFLLLLEDYFLYGPREAQLDKPPAGILVENIDLTDRRGESIHAWWSEAPDWKPEQGAVLICHGNGGNLSHRVRQLAHWINEIDVAALIFDYPGYGKSSGVPSEDGCYAAGEAAYNWLRDQAKVPAERIIIYGGSLGGGIATDLASQRPHRALALVSAFTSFPDMAQTQYPWLPGRWLVRNQYDNLAKITHCHGPVFIAHSPQDGLIPYWQAERLYTAAPGQKRLFKMPGAPHNDSPLDNFYPALRQFLAGCERMAN